MLKLLLGFHDIFSKIAYSPPFSCSKKLPITGNTIIKVINCTTSVRITDLIPPNAEYVVIIAKDIIIAVVDSNPKAYCMVNPITFTCRAKTPKQYIYATIPANLSTNEVP